MATSRRSLIVVFVIALTVGAASFFTAAAPQQIRASTSDPSVVSERSLTVSPPLAPQIRAVESLFDGDHGRRLPNTFGVVGLAGLAIALASLYANRRRALQVPVLALALAPQGPRAPPRPVAFIR